MSLCKVTLAIIGMSVFITCWPGGAPANAQVNVDIPGVHVHVGSKPPPPPPGAAGVEVLTRGPVHEALAEPVVLDEGSAFTINRRPPAPIDEIVPEEKPEGNNIAWIPGYWSWDSDRNDFIWISGIWRAVPPNTSWVPGYWGEAKGSYQWVPGFWTTADKEEIEYLPSPPASLDEGPQGNPPSADSVWIPGYWARVENRYVWRPGFWEQARADWIWEPAHYVCSPRGCIFVDGYWDYPLHRRGVAFLPAYIPPSMYDQAGFQYSPSIVLDLAILSESLFASPYRHHYYFGDYYGSEYARGGYYPWYEARNHHDWYDPIFVHRQWRHHDDAKWFDNQRADYQRRVDDKSLRPARTYTEMQAQAARLPANERQQVVFARPISQVTADKSAPFKFEKLTAQNRQAMSTNVKDVNAYTAKRAQWEGTTPPKGVAPTTPRTGVTPPKEPTAVPPKEGVTPRELPPTPPKEGVTPREPTPAPPKEGVVPKGEATPAPVAGQGEKVKIPKSPIVGRGEGTSKEMAPPPKPEQPKPDPNAKPRPARSETPPEGAKDSGGPEKDKGPNK